MRMGLVRTRMETVILEDEYVFETPVLFQVYHPVPVCPYHVFDGFILHVGKHQIEHDYVELAGLGKLDSLAAGRGDGDTMILGA